MINNLININKMNVEEFYKKSEYSKIDFGSNPSLFTKKELLDFANEYLEAITVTRCCESVKINDKQQNIEAITALTEVVKANNKLFGSEKTMEIANSKIKELMQQL